jgi:hypothetical protein
VDDTSDDEGGERVEFTTSKDLQVFPTFEAMGLKEDLLRGIYNYGACLSPASYPSDRSPIRHVDERRVLMHALSFN